MRSGSTLIRPARSTSAPDCSAICRPSGLAWTPAAHTLVSASTRVELPSGSVTVMPVASTSVTVVPRRTSTPIRFSRARAASAEAVTERREHLVDGVDEDDPRLGGVDSPEVVPERAVRELGDLARHLDTRGSGAHDDEGQGPLLLGRGPGELGDLEGAEDPAAQLQRVVDGLHAGRVTGELVVAEPRLAGAGGDEQRVVRRHPLATQHLRGDGARLQVDVRHGAQQDRGVPLTSQHLARAGGDLPLREDACRDLVEQGLEQVVRRRGDEGDLDVLTATERLRAEETAETRTDDDDAMGAHGGSNAGHQPSMPMAPRRGGGHVAVARRPDSPRADDVRADPGGRWLDRSAQPGVGWWRTGPIST